MKKFKPGQILKWIDSYFYVLNCDLYREPSYYVYVFGRNIKEKFRYFYFQASDIEVVG